MGDDRYFVNVGIFLCPAHCAPEADAQLVDIGQLNTFGVPDVFLILVSAKPMLLDPSNAAVE